MKTKILNFYLINVSTALDMTKVIDCARRDKRNRLSNRVDLHCHLEQFILSEDEVQLKGSAVECQIERSRDLVYICNT